MALALNIPRLVIAATGSGAGKTTATVALVVALRARGKKVAIFKCGPDYLDPTYHERAAGRPSHNLDGWMMGRDAVLAAVAGASRGFAMGVDGGVKGCDGMGSPHRHEGSTR